MAAAMIDSRSVSASNGLHNIVYNSRGISSFAKYRNASMDAG